MGWTRRIGIGAVVLAAAGAGLAAVHEVPTEVTAEDRAYGARILTAADYGPEALQQAPQGFEAELRTVLAVQDAVLQAAVHGEPLPMGSLREPKDLYSAKQGWCFDRSRSIEKMLAAAGMEVRHIAAYRTVGTSPLKALLTPGADPGASHALSEVRTERGWMLVDSNGRWVGLDAQGEVWSAERLAAQDGPLPEWSDVNADAPHPLLTRPFVSVIGLYSRHGGFFPPYTPIPDVNYRQLVQNLI